MSVSIIIPTWNETGGIARTIRGLRVQSPLEIIVVDGGSSDTTIEQAQEADRVFLAEAGRAFQMNAGARAARGDILLFLHADCRLEAGAIRAVEGTLARHATLAGCFSMRVDGQGWGFRSIDACATARVRWTGVIYGDQGLFLRRNDFLRLGGFPPIRFMEDVFFSRRLAGRGRVVVLRQKIFVSPRRWQQAGLARQTLRNWTLTALALAGVAPDRLAEYYPIVR
jgi:rSAM/selenodomain-associated transferase 2